MNFNLDEAVEKIKNNKDFLKLEKIIENNAGHDHEPVYDHSIKTFEIANRLVKGNFILNAEAKNMFEIYIRQEVGGIKKFDLFKFTALIHDIGKVIVFDDGGKKRSLNITSSDGKTSSPQHGYWGSRIVKNITKEVGLPYEVISYIENVIRLHLATIEHWETEHNMSVDEIIWDSKIKLENLHVDVLFNLYSDLYSQSSFKPKEKIMIEIFNNPNFYNYLKYSITD